MPFPYAENASLPLIKIQAVYSSNSNTGMGMGARSHASVCITWVDRLRLALRHISIF